MSKAATRDRIIEAADRLFYEQGFEHSSFAQIAELVGISRGNFYYHFKSKDEILDAVIHYRFARTRSMLDNWEMEADSPAECIHRFINILIMNRAKIKRYGCPVGTLCSELSKLEHVARKDANKLFDLFRHWLKKQFEQLGHSKEADTLAMHLLTMSQGVASLASAFQDEKFIRTEVDRLYDWLITYTNSAQPNSGGI